MTADIPSNIRLHLENLSIRERQLKKKTITAEVAAELADIQAEREQMQRREADQNRNAAKWRKGEADKAAADRAESLKEGVTIVNKMLKRLSSLETLAQEYQQLAGLSLTACAHNDRLKQFDTSRVLKVYPLNQDRLANLESLREELECIGDHWARMTEESQHKEVKS